ncbi:MAG: DNRLRE domain-containing protein [Candidatus Goldbacteria bacterium]|nr:DNRLRE domain-containing protein [Candidatus Goldiibacteriota bacterium]
MKKYIVILAAVLLSGFMVSCKGEAGPAGPAGADGITPESGWYSVVLQQGVDGYTGCYDARIRSFAPDTNYGSDDASQIGYYEPNNDKKRFVIEFFFSDGPEVPDDAVIESVTLSLKTSGAGSGSGAYRLYECSQAWSEGTTTWNNAGVSNWTVAGGNVDINTPVSNSAVLNSSFIGWSTWKVDKNLIEEKMSAGTTFGFVFVADNETTITSDVEIHTSEAVDVQNRPKLTIYYSKP